MKTGLVAGILAALAAAALAGCSSESSSSGGKGHEGHEGHGPATPEAAPAPAPAPTPAAKPAAGAYPMDTCVVSGEKLGEMGDPVIYDHEGTEVRFCCGACVKEFKKDPKKFLAVLEAARAGKK